MSSAVRTLVLVRHGQSTDNEQNLFSGFRNPGLTARGVAEAKAAGRKLKELGFDFDIAFTSKLDRAQRTLTLMLEQLEQAHLPIRAEGALNERDYGELSGLNKAEARSQWSSEQVHLWRKSYDAVPPGGESLAMTAARTIPFYQQELAGRVQKGQRVLVVAHGNSLRSIVMHLENMSPDALMDFNITTSEILIYRFSEAGAVIGKTSVVAPPPYDDPATDSCSKQQVEQSILVSRLVSAECRMTQSRKRTSRSSLAAFYAKVQCDPVIGPVFARVIPDGDWPRHLVVIQDFWSAVLLKSGGYKGNPFGKHQRLGELTPLHFTRWLTLFEQTAAEMFSADVAMLLTERANRIGDSLKAGLFFRPGPLRRDR